VKRAYFTVHVLYSTCTLRGKDRSPVGRGELCCTVRDHAKDSLSIFCLERNKKNRSDVKETDFHD